MNTDQREKESSTVKRKKKRGIIKVLKLLYTLTCNSSAENPEPIFNNAVKAAAEAEPNSSAEANKGSNCENQNCLT